MAQQSTVDVLNRVLMLHSRSLPQYLVSAQPWSAEKDARARQALQNIAEDQQLMVDRIGSAIMAAGGCPYLGQYPMSFTGMHDLSVDYLVRQVTQRQERDIQTMRECVAQLQHTAAPRALAEEALGAAEGHLQNLEELMQPDLSVVPSQSP